MNIKFIKQIEEKFDAINSDYGSKNEYCIYCKSKRYNSKVGIVHDVNCPLFELRYLIVNYKNLE